ncbi:MAG: hypothetical protein HRU19_23935 [Pseudobacteriovorax sp.]|nr:hypothetical protein [Pseudobacteriovorax sp.]
MNTKHSILISLICVYTVVSHSACQRPFRHTKSITLFEKTISDQIFEYDLSSYAEAIEFTAFFRIPMAPSLFDQWLSLNRITYRISVEVFQGNKSLSKHSKVFTINCLNQRNRFISKNYRQETYCQAHRLAVQLNRASKETSQRKAKLTIETLDGAFEAKESIQAQEIVHLNSYQANRNWQRLSQVERENRLQFIPVNKKKLLQPEQIHRIMTEDMRPITPRTNRPQSPKKVDLFEDLLFSSTDNIYDFREEYIHAPGISSIVMLPNTSNKLSFRMIPMDSSDATAPTLSLCYQRQAQPSTNCDQKLSYETDTEISPLVFPRGRLIVTTNSPGLIRPHLETFQHEKKNMQLSNRTASPWFKPQKVAKDERLIISVPNTNNTESSRLVRFMFWTRDAKATSVKIITTAKDDRYTHVLTLPEEAKPSEFDRIFEKGQLSLLSKPSIRYISLDPGEDSIILENNEDTDIFVSLHLSNRNSQIRQKIDTMGNSRFDQNQISWIKLGEEHKSPSRLLSYSVKDSEIISSQPKQFTSVPPADTASGRYLAFITELPPSQTNSDVSVKIENGQQICSDHLFTLNSSKKTKWLRIGGRDLEVPTGFGEMSASTDLHKKITWNDKNLLVYGIPCEGHLPTSETLQTRFFYHLGENHIRFDFDKNLEQQSITLHVAFTRALDQSVPILINVFSDATKPHTERMQRFYTRKSRLVGIFPSQLSSFMWDPKTGEPMFWYRYPMVLNQDISKGPVTIEIANPFYKSSLMALSVEDIAQPKVSFAKKTMSDTGLGTFDD